MSFGVKTSTVLDPGARAGEDRVLELETTGEPDVLRKLKDDCARADGLLELRAQETEMLREISTLIKGKKGDQEKIPEISVTNSELAKAESALAECRSALEKKSLEWKSKEKIMARLRAEHWRLETEHEVATQERERALQQLHEALEAKAALRRSSEAERLALSKRELALGAELESFRGSWKKEQAECKNALAASERARQAAESECLALKERFAELARQFGANEATLRGLREELVRDRKSRLESEELNARAQDLAKKLQGAEAELASLRQEITLAQHRAEMESRGAAETRAQAELVRAGKDRELDQAREQVSRVIAEFRRRSGEHEKERKALAEAYQKARSQFEREREKLRSEFSARMERVRREDESKLNALRENLASSRAQVEEAAQRFSEAQRVWGRDLEASQGLAAENERLSADVARAESALESERARVLTLEQRLMAAETSLKGIIGSRARDSAAISALEQQVIQARSEREAERRAKEQSIAEREECVARFSGLSASLEKERSELGLRAAAVQDYEKKLRAYVGGLSQARQQVRRVALQLSEEIEAGHAIHPLRDYLSLTEFELTRLEVELRRTPTSFADRPRLEVCASELQQQRDFLRGVIESSKTQIAEYVKVLNQAVQDDLLGPVPPVPKFEDKGTS